MADGPKIIEFRSSDSGSGGGGTSPSTSLTPYDPVFAEKQKAEAKKVAEEAVEHLYEAMRDAWGAQSPFFINPDGSVNTKTNDELGNTGDMFNGAYDPSVSGGDDPPYDDPFSFMDEDDGRFFSDDVKKWLDELEEEYKTQAELLERSNQAYDELTEQADSLAEAEEDFAINLEHFDSVVELTVAAFFALITASLAFNRVVNELVEAVGGFSADVVQASMRSRLQEIEDRLQLASQAGGVIADLENTRSDLASEFRHLMRELIELVGPTLNQIAKVMTATVGKATMFTEAWNDFNKFQQQLALAIAAMRAANEGNIAELIRIRKALEESNKDTPNNLNQSIDNLFDPENIWDDDDDGAIDMPGGDPRGRAVTPNGKGF